MGVALMVDVKRWQSAMEAWSLPGNDGQELVEIVQQPEVLSSCSVTLTSPPHCSLHGTV